MTTERNKIFYPFRCPILTFSFLMPTLLINPNLDFAED